MECSAVPDDATAHPDGCRDASAPEVVSQDQPQSDARPRAPIVWDAWDDARQAEAADAAHRCRALPDAGAGKLADRELGALEPAALLIVQSVHQVEAAELCRQDAARFAARSCAEPELPAWWEQPLQPDVAALQVPMRLRFSGLRAPVEQEAPRRQVELAARDAVPA